MIAVKKNIFMNVLDVTSSLCKNILVARLSISNTFAIRLILVYGPQENEAIEDREMFMTEVSIEIQKCVDFGDIPMVIGDLNAKLDVINGSVVHVSPNGKLLKRVVEEHDMKIVNFTEKCIGKWTHEIRTTKEKSILDYIVVPDSLLDTISEMIIDEDCMMCPFANRKKSLKYTDHNACLLLAEINIPKREKVIPELRWKFNDECLMKIKELTSSEVFTRKNLTGDIQCDYDCFENSINQILSQTCRKQKKRPIDPRKVCDKFVRYILMLSKYGKRGRSQRNVVKKYRDMIIEMNSEEEGRVRREHLSTTIKELTVNGCFSPNEFWKVKKSVVRKTEQVSSIVDPVVGTELFGEGPIREAYQKEFTTRLEHRKIDPSLKEYEEKTNSLARLYVQRASLQKGPPITMEELDAVMKELKDGKCPGTDRVPPEFYKSVGDGMKMYILDIMNEIKEQVKIPYQWTETLIATIYKNKGSRKHLKNYRGIFLTQIVSKLYEKIHMKRVQDRLEKVSKLQAGSRKQRGPADNLFLVKSCIDHANYLNSPVYITVYDFEQCFDALWLEESIIALWNLGIRDETLSTIYEMNKQTMIKVKTPLGVCQGFSRPTIVKQGTVFGPLTCSTSTAEFVSKNKNVGGFQIGESSINTVILVDDVGNINGGVVDVIKSHKNMSEFSMVKRLPLGGVKCFLLPIFCRNKELPILKIESHVMEVKELILYLGAYFNGQGNNKDLINDRIQKARTCMVNSIAMCSDVTLGVYVIQSLMLVYKSVFIAVLLYACQVWTRLTKNEEKKLETLQLQFLKQILHVPRSTCNCYTFLELGVLPVSAEIHIRKLTFLYHILSLDHDDPVLLTYQQQCMYESEKNWGNECNELRKTYGLEMKDDEIVEMSLDAWKKKVKESVKMVWIENLNKEKQKMKKVAGTDEYKNFECQQYMKSMRSDHARLLFRIRARISGVKEHRKFEFNEDNMMCRVCGEGTETLHHVLSRCQNLCKPVVMEGDEYSTDTQTLEMVAARMAEFLGKVDV